MHVLKHEQLDEGYFTRISAREDDVFHKPDPRAFEPILVDLAWHGIPKEKCLYVGDSSVDIEAGRNIGITTVIVRTGPYHHGHHKTHPLPATHVIKSVANLPLWIQRD